MKRIEMQAEKNLYLLTKTRSISKSLFADVHNHLLAEGNKNFGIYFLCATGGGHRNVQEPMLKRERKLGHLLCFESRNGLRNAFALLIGNRMFI